MNVADPAPWGDQQPTVPQGYQITAIATDPKIPRQTLVLPNGDILIAEGRGGNAPSLKPKDVIAGYIKGKGTTSVESGNRLTLLCDGDGDGVEGQVRADGPPVEVTELPSAINHHQDSQKVAAAITPDYR